MDQRNQSGDLYRLIHKEGTHLAPSKDTEGAFRGSLLDNETRQIAGQAEWVKVDESVYRHDAPYDQDPGQKKELSPEAQLAVKLIADGSMWVLSEVVAPRAIDWWHEKASPLIKEKWDDVRSKKKYRKTGKGEPQVPEIAVTGELTVGTFPQVLDKAYEKYVYAMTSEEAQRELVDIFLLSIMIIAKIRKLSNARIVMDGSMPGEFLEGKDIIQKITAPKYVASINQILEKNPLLLEEKSATLSEILGCSIVLDCQYLPIESNQLKEKLMVLGGLIYD